MPARRLKIGFVLDDSLDYPDGVQQYVVTVGEWLRHQGHDVYYLVSSTHRRDLVNVYPLAENVGVNFNGNYLRTPLPAPKLLIQTLLDAEQFDILHVQMPFSPLLAGRIISSADPKTVIVGTFHIVPRTWLASLLSYLLGVWTRDSLARFGAIMSVSEPAQTYASRVFRIASTVMRNPVKLEVFRGVTPRKPDDNKLEILFLGRLVPRKGCIYLLEALELLSRLEGVPDWHTTICGTGPQAPKLKRYVQDHGLQDYVTFKGFVPEAEKPTYYASTDITVFPSTGGESFGIVLLEAMASGLSAVIAGDNPGYRSVLEPCPDEVLFDPKDTIAFARKLRQLLRDKRKRRHIADWQCHYARNFDIEQVGREILKVYVSALQHHKHMR